MSKTTRWVLTIFAVVALLFAATVGVAATAVYRAGMIAVEVDEVDGNHFDVSLPAGLARLAIALVPTSMLEEFTTELVPVLPAIRAGWDEFSRTPDFTLVEVRSSREHVRIIKEGDRLIVLVESDRENVRVSIPLHTVGALISRLDRAASTAGTHTGI